MKHEESMTLKESPTASSKAGRSRRSWIGSVSSGSKKSQLKSDLCSPPHSSAQLSAQCSEFSSATFSSLLLDPTQFISSKGQFDSTEVISIQCSSGQVKSRSAHLNVTSGLNRSLSEERTFPVSIPELILSMKWLRGDTSSDGRLSW